MKEPDRRRPGCARNQRGLTLIETMVAMVISLILIGGVIQIFVGSKQTYRFQESLSRVQESGRYALEAMSRDLRMAGYRGCQGSDVELTNTLNDSTDYEWNFEEALEGHEAVDDTWSPALDADIQDPEPGSDVFTIRSADITDVTVINHPGGSPPGSAALEVPVNNGFEKGDIVMVTDCQAAAVFQVTNDDPEDGTLVHNTGGSVSPGNATQELGKEFTGGQVTRTTTRTYYVRQGAAGLPSLWRRVNDAPAVELVENVERMRIRYGVDTDDDRRIDEYQTASAVADWENVLSVRISLLLAGVEDNITEEPQQVTFDGATFTVDDRRLYQVMTTTVALRNRLP